MYTYIQRVCLQVPLPIERIVIQEVPVHIDRIVEKVVYKDVPVDRVQVCICMYVCSV
jgi:hypothetical protein